MTVAPPERGRTYKLTIAPVVATSRALMRAWRGVVSADTTWREQRKTAPFPVFRWAAGIGILIWVASGAPPHSASQWFTANLPWLIVAGVLTIGPDVARIEFGGMKMELLRETREELRGLSAQVQQLQIQQATANSNATAGVIQNFHSQAEAVREATEATKEGEAAKSVPAEAVSELLARALARSRTFSPSWTSSPSTSAEQGSTVEE